MKFALIGYSGYWGEKLAGAVAKSGHQITDRYDSKNDKIEDTDADAVIIATPPDTHYPIAMRCMKLGLDVLLEKPMATRLSHAKELATFANKNGIVLSVDSTFVHTAAFRWLDTQSRPLISYQSLRLAPPMPQAKINAGWDLIVHDLSILEAMGFLVDDKQIANTGVGIEDGSVAVAALVLSTGGSAFIMASRAWPTKVREIVLHYPNGIYRWTLDGLYTEDGQVVVLEDKEPLISVIEDFAYRCGNREIRGKTDGDHAARVVARLHQIFPQHSTLGVKSGSVGNGLCHNESSKYLSV